MAVRQLQLDRVRYLRLTHDVVHNTRARLEEGVKKKDPALQSALQEEVERLVMPLLQQAQPTGLLPWEQMFRDALLAAGRQLFEPMLQQRIDQIDRAYQPHPKFRPMG